MCVLCRELTERDRKEKPCDEVRGRVGVRGDEPPRRGEVWFWSEGPGAVNGRLFLRRRFGMRLLLLVRSGGVKTFTE